MDAINSAATFLLIRMKLDISEHQVIQALLLLFGVSDRNEIITSLVNRVSKISKLQHAYNSWLASGKIEKLQPEDIYSLFTHAHIFNFAAQLKTTDEKVTTAMCELIPFLIRRFSIEKSQGSYSGSATT